MVAAVESSVAEAEVTVVTLVVDEVEVTVVISADEEEVEVKATVVEGIGGEAAFVVIGAEEVGSAAVEADLRHLRYLEMVRSLNLMPK